MPLNWRKLLILEQEKLHFGKSNVHLNINVGILMKDKVFNVYIQNKVIDVYAYKQT